MLSASEALKRLQEGNARFVSHIQNRNSSPDHIRRYELVDEQRPFAIILGCADARVPAEIIFDQGVGDLFVVRVAGNVVAPSLLGSIEFAAERFGSALVVVLGHTMCGAIQATLDALVQATEDSSPNLHVIIECIRPSIESLLGKPGLDSETLINKAVRANIHASVKQLQNGSPILKKLIKRDELLIVGAEYALKSGEVDFLESKADI